MLWFDMAGLDRAVKVRNGKFGYDQFWWGLSRQIGWGMIG